MRDQLFELVNELYEKKERLLDGDYVDLMDRVMSVYSSSKEDESNDEETTVVTPVVPPRTCDCPFEHYVMVSPEQIEANIEQLDLREYQIDAATDEVGRMIRQQERCSNRRCKEASVYEIYIFLIKLHRVEPDLNRPFMSGRTFLNTMIQKLDEFTNLHNLTWCEAMKVILVEIREELHPVTK